MSISIGKRKNCRFRLIDARFRSTEHRLRIEVRFQSTSLWFQQTSAVTYLKPLHIANRYKFGTGTHMYTEPLRQYIFEAGTYSKPVHIFNNEPGHIRNSITYSTPVHIRNHNLFWTGTISNHDIFGTDTYLEPWHIRNRYIFGTMTYSESANSQQKHFLLLLL